MIHLHIYTIESDIKRKSKELLNSNLKHYLNTDSFVVNYSDNGKPTTDGLFFSISHCNNKLVQVFTTQGEIGIDVEYKNPKRKFRSLTKRYFHLKEHQLIQRLDEAEAKNCFYQLWTVKEAICKAQGGRLWYYLHDNYVDKDKKIVTCKHQFNIMYLNAIDQYCLAIAMADKQDVTIHHA